MAILTISIEPDELLGLDAVAALSPPADGTEAGAAGVARALLQERLAARLDELGLPWAPSPEAVRRRAAEAAEAREPLAAGRPAQARQRRAGAELLPLVFPTILLPALLKWISGNAAERASQEAEAARERSGSSPAVSQPKA